jgi:hypothetical protein
MLLEKKALVDPDFVLHKVEIDDTAELTYCISRDKDVVLGCMSSPVDIKERYFAAIFLTEDSGLDDKLRAGITLSLYNDGLNYAETTWERRFMELVDDTISEVLPYLEEKGLSKGSLKAKVCVHYAAKRCFSPENFVGEDTYKALPSLEGVDTDVQMRSYI